MTMHKLIALIMNTTHKTNGSTNRRINKTNKRNSKNNM